MRRALFAAVSAAVLLVPVFSAVPAVAGAPSAPTRTVTAPAGSDDSGTAPPAAGTQPDDQPPAGADDGIAVGSEDVPHHKISVPTAARPNTVGPNADAARYFGNGPWSAITSVANTATKCTGLDRYELQAMMVAPVFKESSGGTSASSAPAPMTLSRYDEWSGTKAGNTNVNANYGLYAFRDPYTPYKRAFWHPGIGIWQYDSAGVGAPFTAAERMDTANVSTDVASSMRDAWCDPSAWINHGAPYTDAERRAAAWAPWWYTDNGGCPLCEQAYADMTPNASTRFSNITLVPMAAAGGAVLHSCTLTGFAGTFPCWYIDPSRAEGASWWASLTPLDGGSPTVQPTPIADPFYVIKRAGLEQRYWLRADTGYTVDLSGTRVLGKNARPKTNQSGSGVSWSNGAGLCDLTANRGDCGPGKPPTGVHSTAVESAGPFQPVALDATGDGKGDIFWYAPGSGVDYLWIGTGQGGFSSVRTPPVGAGYQLRVGDIDGNGKDDLVFYNPSTGVMSVWRSVGDGTFVPSSVGTTYRLGTSLQVMTLDHNGNSRSEILLYGPGSRPDAIWEWNGSGFVKSVLGVGDNFQLIVADVDGNGRDDVIWNRPATTSDYVWLTDGSGRFISRNLAIPAGFQVLAGNVDGDAADDLILYSRTASSVTVLFGAGWAELVERSYPLSGSYQPFVADMPNNGRAEVYWYAPGGGPDRWSRWSFDRSVLTTDAGLGGTQQPVVGAFSTGGGDGILWYGTGTLSDWIWWQ